MSSFARTGRSAAVAGVAFAAGILTSASASGLGPPDAGDGAGTAPDRAWEEAKRAELAGFDHDRDDRELAVGCFRRAGELFESVARQRSEPSAASEAYWRSARSFWLAADAMPRDAKEERVAYYLRAEALAEKGMELYPDCAGCMLWRFSSMGRLATTRGIWTAGRQVPVMADLLARGIELAPTHADNDQNSLLGNLHYSSAIFYRVLPDWFLMSWLFGVRGDKERSLRHIRTALELHPDRLEYQVELGSQLLCLATSRGDEEQLAQGRKVLFDAVQREPKSLDDEREIEAGRIMLALPHKSCGYSGDSWLEIDRKRAEQVVEK